MFFDDILFDSNIKMMNTPRLFNEKEGLMYGNMFRNEYVPYKNYHVTKLNALSEKEELLLNIYEYDFALNDLSLYLDLHPDDDYTYNLFRKYTEESKKYIDLYEKKYGPLDLCDSNYTSYMWEKGPWPFTGGSLNV